MKKMNKKGFTIVELVIVIAVIAILAAVMIPTFSGIVTKAQKSALEQKIAAAYKEAMANDLSDDGQFTVGTAGTPVNGITFTFTNVKGDATASFTEQYDYTSATITDGKVVLDAPST